MKKIEEELKQLLTPEFMETLILAVKTCGWEVDLCETTQFVYWCLYVLGRDGEKPDLTPLKRI